MISLAHAFGRRGESWASTKNHIRSDFKNGKRLNRRQLANLKRVHAGEVIPGIRKKATFEPDVVLTTLGTEKITGDTKNGTPPPRVLPGKIVNRDAESADHTKLYDPNILDTPTLWDGLEAIVADTIGGSEIREVMLSRGTQLDHNDFAVLRDVADVALQFGNVSIHSEEYARAMSDLISRIRNSHN